MDRPSARRRLRCAPRCIAVAWLWVFAALWSALPALDARMSHGGAGLPIRAVAQSAAPDATVPVVVGNDTCELCDLLHSAGGWPAGACGIAAPLNAIAPLPGVPHAREFAAAERQAPARAPPAV